MLSTRSKGFTVIELLVAVGVTALLVTLMINIVTTVLSNWNRTSGALSSSNQARLVLDQISQDLQGVILKTDGNVWLAASIQTAAGSGTPDENWSGGKPNTSDSLEISPDGLDIQDYRFGQAGVWLRFFSIPSGDPSGTDVTASISAPRAISYQIVRRKIGGSSSSQFAYQLFRSEVLPYSDNPTRAAASTFTVGYNLFTNSTPGYMNPDSQLGYAGNIRSPNPDQVIASGIVDFGVRMFANNSAGVLTEIFPVDRINGSVERVALAATSDNTKVQPNISPSPGISAANTSYAFPSVAEVMIRVLTPEGIRLLEAKEDPALSSNIPQSWWEIVEQNSQVYTRRIDIKSTAL